MKVTNYKTLDAAVKDGVLQAVNISDMGRTRPKGQLVFKIPTENQDEVVVTMPPTWINIDLRMYAPVGDIGKSVQLRQLLRSGSLVLITQESAEKLEALPNYKAEFDRVMALQRNSQSNSDVSHTGNTVELNTGNISEPHQEDTADSKPEQETPTTGRLLSPSSLQLLQLDQNGDGTEMFQLATVVFPEMSKDDFIEISANITNPVSLLSNLCSDAIGAIEVGEDIDVSMLPTYLEWSVNKSTHIET